MFGRISPLVQVDHPRFRWVEAAIFERRLVADCLTYNCKQRNEAKVRPDVCCQYGADVDSKERDSISAHRALITPLLRPGAQATAWFTGNEETDLDYPSGKRDRTVADENGCVFLRADGRGCAVHTALATAGLPLLGTKPMICRLYPITWDIDSLVLTEDYEDYQCAFEASAPTIYDVQRDTLADLFGQDVVAALDRVRDRRQRTKLPIVVTE